ncbi:MAG: 2-C-methyl-D-erythritol 2,4-cyclodiphosphate synthase [Opitutales bacterium]|nr:2-C-methyl-D-erythritol 2,4-cyclodiphosphate synthase [Opitutales bacterium]
MTAPLPIRIGFGYDIHRIERDRPLVLAGVKIPGSIGLAGHSDADVMTHAIADAVLGGAGLPDIGHYFPPSDPTIRGIDSQKILAKAREEVDALGYYIGNIDCTLIAEAPRIGPFREQMKTALSDTLGIEPGQIGIKATSNEELDDLGQRLGMAAHAVCCLLLK